VGADYPPLPEDTFSGPVQPGDVRDDARSSEVSFVVRADPGGVGYGGVAGPCGPTPVDGAGSGGAGSRRYRAA
jgi:hypothetical protein